MIERLRSGDTFAVRCGGAPRGLSRLLHRHARLGRADGESRHRPRPAGRVHRTRHRSSGQDHLGALIYPAVVACMAIVSSSSSRPSSCRSSSCSSRRFNASFPSRRVCCSPCRTSSATGGGPSSVASSCRGCCHRRVASILGGKAWLDAVMLGSPSSVTSCRTAILERVCRDPVVHDQGRGRAARSPEGDRRGHEQRRLPQGPQHRPRGDDGGQRTR